MISPTPLSYIYIVSRKWGWHSITESGYCAHPLKLMINLGAFCKLSGQNEIEISDRQIQPAIPGHGRTKGRKMVSTSNFKLERFNAFLPKHVPWYLLFWYFLYGIPTKPSVWRFSFLNFYIEIILISLPSPTLMRICICFRISCFNLSFVCFHHHATQTMSGKLQYCIFWQREVICMLGPYSVG